MVISRTGKVWVSSASAAKKLSDKLSLDVTRTPFTISVIRPTGLVFPGVGFALLPASPCSPAGPSDTLCPPSSLGAPDVYRQLTISSATFIWDAARC